MSLKPQPIMPRISRGKRVDKKEDINKLEKRILNMAEQVDGFKHALDQMRAELTTMVDQTRIDALASRIVSLEQQAAKRRGGRPKKVD